MMDGSLVGVSVPQPSSDGVQIGPLLRLLRRHAWLIALCAVLGAVGAYAYARTVPKLFTASSLIAVEGDRFAIPELQGALRNDNAPDPMPWVRTEVQAIASRDLVQTVVDKLQLAALPEFNPGLRPPGLLQGVKDAVMSLLPQPPGPGGDSSPNEAVLGSVSRSLAIFQDNRSLVIDVSFTSQDPALSARIVNTLVAEYIAARAKRRVTANQGANTAMTDRIDQVRQDLAALEQQMRDLRSKSDLVGLRAGSLGQQQLEELATAATRAGVERAQLQTTFDRATALAKQGSSDALASVLGSSTVSRLREQEGTASRRVAELMTRYGAGYPGVRSAQAELGSAQRQLREETQRIVSSLGTQLRAARENEADVQKQLNAARRSGLAADNSRAQLEQLQQEVTTRRTMYQTLLERAQQTVVQPSGTETPDVRVVSQAAAPGSPSSPNMKIAAGSGGMAGTMLGCLLALTRIRTSRSLHKPADLAAAAGLPLSATLQRTLLGRGRSGRPGRAAPVPGGVEAEELRSLRFRLARLGQVSAPRSVVLTGLGSGDAAARIALGLARVAALDGERVLLIEGDLQAPSVASMLGQQHGELLTLLERNGDWRDLVSPDAATPLQALASVQPSQQSHTLVGGIAFQNLLVEAQAQYDLVVLTAPAAARPDALVLVQHADAAVLVIDGATDRREQVQDATGRLGAMSRNPLATVLLAA
jgi:succinoglycan biosynthesis transport protein ExoP